jgi:hypothetical protein
MATAGYSGTPLPKKLGIAAGHRLMLLHAPAGFDDTLGELPPDVTVVRRLSGRADVVVAFVDRRSHLEAAIERLGTAIFPAGSVWVAWPKKASGVPTDMTEDRVRDAALPLGLVDTKVCAIDPTWSGLRLVWRKERRGAAP